MDGLLAMPFSKIVEDTMVEMREKASDNRTRAKYKARVNRFYQETLPIHFEHDWLIKEGSITLVASYSTGTVAISAGGTALTGTSTVWTSAMTGRKIKISGDNEIYTFTYVSATSGTISPALLSTTALSGASYAIFQDTYDLPDDYSRMTREPGVYYDNAGSRTDVEFAVDEARWNREYTTTQTDFATLWREGKGYNSSTQRRQLQITPPPSGTRLLRFDYVKALRAMREYRSGTATTTNGSTSVSLSQDLSSFISAGQYFRIDSNEDAGLDDTWIRIASVSTNVLTLDQAYPASYSAKAYTVSDMPDMPYEMHGVVFMGACWETSKDQNDPSKPERFADLRNAIDKLMSVRARKGFGRRSFK